MVGAGFIKKKFSNVGKFALAFSIFSAQLLPIQQAAHAAGDISSVYKIPKSNTADKYINIKIPFKANVGELLLLNWQTLPNSNIASRTLAFGGVCNLTSSDGKVVKFLDGQYEGVKSELEFNSENTPHIFFIATSSNLALNCKLTTTLSEGNLKVSQYSFNSSDGYSLPANGLIELKTAELLALTFQGKAGNRLSFTVDSYNLGVCHIYSISDSANSNPKRESWDGGYRQGLIGASDIDPKIRPQLVSFTPITNGTYFISCKLDADYFPYPKKYIRIDLKEGDLKLLRPQAFEAGTTVPAKCPVAKAPSKAPKISVAKNGLFIQYSENGFSDLPGCIDGFRVYATAMNPYTKKEFEEHGSWSIPIADCKPPVKGLISCLISFEKDWLLKLKNQDASLNTMAINASAVNSQGESIFSQRVFLFEKDPNLIAVACASMQASFANNLISSPSNAFATQAKWGAAAGVVAGLVTILITGGAAIPLVVGAGVAMAAASAAKEVSARRSTDIDKNAAKKFIETYPVTALDLLILMKKSSNPDVRAMSETFQKAIQASDLIKIYRPLIGENNALTDFEVRKIIADEKFKRMEEVEASNFEKNGDKDLKSLFGKNSKFKGVLVKNASKISQGVDSFLVFKEQIQNNQSAENFILPNNCWFG